MAPHHRGPLGSSTPADKRAPPTDSALSTSHDTTAKPAERGVIDAQGPCTTERSVELVNCSQARGQSPNNETGQTTKPELQQIDPTTADSEDYSRTSAFFQAASSPLGDGNFYGIDSIIMPVSTLDLLFKRLDMLKKQLDDLASLGKRSLPSRGVSSLLAEKEVKKMMF